jgi:YD repeat-containing protein
VSEVTRTFCLAVCAFALVFLKGWGSTEQNSLGLTATASASLSAPIPQYYAYDTVNRLSAVSDTGYYRAMCYDAYGNYWVTNYTGDTPLPGNAPQAIGGGCPAGSTTPYSVKGNNQQNGVNYDPAGNQSAYATSALLWDAENRMTAFGATTVYNYDASGQRVSKTIGGTQTNYVYL